MTGACNHNFSKNCTIPLFESEANLFLLVCRIKGAAGRYPFRKEYEFSRDNITQIIHLCFDLINSYLLSCKALWSLTAFKVNVLSLAMITIETLCLKPKRLFILGKNFHVKTTQISLQSQFCNKRNF